jgi:hypothetical protein
VAALTPGTGADSSDGALAVSERRRTMTLVGFKPVQGAGRVFVRTSEPVKYSVSEAGDRTLVLELENTRIPTENDRRPLDTSFFNTAVAQVQAETTSSRNVRIQIKLKQNVAYEARQEGNEVVLDFQQGQAPAAAQAEVKP